MKVFGRKILKIAPEEIPKLSVLKENPCRGLYVAGENCANSFCVGIVGTRRCDAYGETMATMLAKSLAGCGAVIISGGAAGIDTAAHRGALGAGGKTIAVLGSGFDILYPAENRTLFEEITGSGALMSEYPPGTLPLRVYFSERNRIIAALSDLLIAVQAPRMSGTLITAKYSLDLGKPVLALPGDIWYENSFGTNALFERGAIPVYSPIAILRFVPEGMKEPLKRAFEEWFHPSSRINLKPQGWEELRWSDNFPEGDSSELEKKVIKALTRKSFHIDGLLKSFEDRDALFQSLMRLELKGIIRRLDGGFYALVKKV